MEAVSTFPGIAPGRGADLTVWASQAHKNPGRGWNASAGLVVVGLELDLEEGREGIVGGCPAELSGIGDTDRGVGGQRIVEAGFGDEGIAVARRALDGERTAALEGERGGR